MLCDPSIRKRKASKALDSPVCLGVHILISHRPGVLFIVTYAKTGSRVGISILYHKLRRAYARTRSIPAVFWYTNESILLDSNATGDASGKNP